MKKYTLLKDNDSSILVFGSEDIKNNSKTEYLKMRRNNVNYEWLVNEYHNYSRKKEFNSELFIVGLKGAGYKEIVSCSTMTELNISLKHLFPEEFI